MIDEGILLSDFENTLNTKMEGVLMRLKIDTIRKYDPYAWKWFLVNKDASYGAINPIPVIENPEECLFRLYIIALKKKEEIYA